MRGAAEKTSLGSVGRLASSPTRHACISPQGDPCLLCPRAPCWCGIRCGQPQPAMQLHELHLLQSARSMVTSARSQKKRRRLTELQPNTRQRCIQRPTSSSSSTPKDFSLESPAVPSPAPVNTLQCILKPFKTAVITSGQTLQCASDFKCDCTFHVSRTSASNVNTVETSSSSTMHVKLLTK